MTDRELMQMALDALSMAVEPKKGKVYAFEFQPIDCAAMHFKAIEALRARLAEPEVDVCCQNFDKCLRSCTPRGQWIAHKAAQREWQGLTDEEVKDIVWNLPYEPSQEHIRAIEAKLKEKNT